MTRRPTPLVQQRIDALERVAELEAALFAIMRVTDPGDIRSRTGRIHQELAVPARKIAREALGLPLGGQVMIDGRWVDADD